MSRDASKQSDKLEARKMLLENFNLKRGDTVYTILRSVSRSGMQRKIDLYIFKNGEPLYLSGYAATLTGHRRDKDGAIITNGAGMDMGFDLVYNLSCALFSPDKYDHDAAYALKQRWI